jgi:hypothetical protein
LLENFSIVLKHTKHPTTFSKLLFSSSGKHTVSQVKPTNLHHQEVLLLPRNVFRVAPLSRNVMVKS